jgi:hypothetical protein
VVHNSDADDKVGSSLAVGKSEAIGNSNINIRHSGIKLGAVFPRPTELSTGKLDERLTSV